MSILFSGRIKSIFSGLALVLAFTLIPVSAQARTCGVMSKSFHCLTGVTKANKTARKVHKSQKIKVSHRSVGKSQVKRRAKKAVKRRAKKSTRSKRSRLGKIHTIGRRIDARSVRKLTKRRSSKRRLAKKPRKSRKSRKLSSKRGWRTRSKSLGFRSARRGISTSCFPARLRKLLAKVSAHYGRKLVITSGYRSRRHNRRIGGASRSQHIHCTAADFYVPGVNKYTLARYLKGLPGRGGVGTYSGNRTVHLDVGPRRTWHWGSKKRSKRRYSKRKRIRSNRRARRTSKRRHASKSWKRRFRGAQS